MLLYHCDHQPQRDHLPQLQPPTTTTTTNHNHNHNRQDNDHHHDVTMSPATNNGPMHTNQTTTMMDNRWRQKVTGKAGDDQNKPKWHVWHRLGSRYIFFFFFMFFYILTNDFIAFRCSIYGLNVWGGLGMPATTKTGPNDARCVVWALGMCFILSSCLFNTNQCFLLCI